MNPRALAPRLAAGLAVLLAAACGQKGDPRPPLRPAPGALGDVAVRRIDDRVEIRFTVPAANEDGTTPSAIERVEIYAVTSAPGAALPEVAGMQKPEHLKARLDIDRTPQPPATPVRPRPGERTMFVDPVGPLRSAAAPPVISYVLAGVIGGRRRPTARFDVPLAIDPPAPAGATLTWTEQSLVFAWQAREGVTAFRVYEAEAGRPRDAQPPSDPPVTAPSFETPVRFGVERCLAVRSVHVAGAVTIEGPASAVLCQTPEDTFPPPAPANLSGLSTGNAISLTWTAVQAPDLAGYIVLRGDAGGATLTPLSGLVTGATFVDDRVTAGTTYQYEVVSVDRSPRQNRSAPSNRITVVARGDMVRLYRIASSGAPLYAAEREGQWRLIDGDIFGAFREGPVIASEGVALLAPVTPSKIVCVGLNYKDHAAEQSKPLPEEPLIFIKPSTSVIGPGAPIEVPAWAGRVDHEAELGIVIGKPTYRVKMNKAAEHILGLIAVNDVTARELQARDGQYTRAKGFDTFAPIGPCIAAGLDGRDLQVRAYVNGQLRQDSRTRELVFTIPELVEFISSVMTLLPGDIISTGTPSGIGPIRPGDQVTVHVEGVGALTNPVVAATP